jgi:hypothetical protein
MGKSREPEAGNREPQSDPLLLSGYRLPDSSGGNCTFVCHVHSLSDTCILFLQVIVHHTAIRQA